MKKPRASGATLKAAVRLYGDDDRLLAFADVTVAGLLVAKGLRVLKKKDGEPTVAFPMRKSKGGGFFEVVSPASAEARDVIKNAVLRAYRKAAGS